MTNANPMGPAERNPEKGTALEHICMPMVRSLGLGHVLINRLYIYICILHKDNSESTPPPPPFTFAKDNF